MYYSYTTFRLLALVVLLVVTLVACNSTANPISTALLPTTIPINNSTAHSPQPTVTPSPTPTNTPTLTTTPTEIPTPSDTPWPTVTAGPFPTSQQLWNFVVGERENGSWCEGTGSKGYQWAMGLLNEAAKHYSIPKNNATGQFSVSYQIQGRPVGFPDGVEMTYGNRLFLLEITRSNILCMSL
jgi:hypothetical protein